MVPPLADAIGFFRVAPEGVPILLTLLGISLAIVALGRRLWWILAGLNAVGLWFFRDPLRTVPPLDECTVLAPADGKVVAVEHIADEPDLAGPASRISIFLSLFDVHVQRAPISGRVLTQRYSPGTFKLAFHEKASDCNEQLTTLLAGDKHQLKLTQIAGYVARRIVCHLKPGDKCQAGDRIGMIRFGSRVDLTVPRETVLQVATGDKVIGGETIIGRLP